VLSQVDFQVANALDLPFPDNTFDVVLSIESSTYMPDKRSVIALDASYPLLRCLFLTNPA
jgi:ubiquinone/menaquinone biosynthesis C-methylase UbiE